MRAKISYWVMIAIGLFYGIAVVTFVWTGTEKDRPYDERTYAIALAVLALIFMFKFLDWAGESKKKIGKDKQEQK